MPYSLHKSSALSTEELRALSPSERLTLAVALTNEVRMELLSTIQHLDELAQRRYVAEFCYGAEAAARMFGRLD